jgi:hypothetical protein
VKRRLLTLVAVIATIVVATTALAMPSWAASDPVFTVPNGLVTRMNMSLDFSGASVTSPQGEDLAVQITADHGDVVPNGASTPICTLNPTPGQLCFYSDSAGPGALNFRGTESQVNQVMNSLKYIPDVDFPQPGNATLNDTLGFSATEQDIPMGRSSGIVDAPVRVEPDNVAPVFDTVPDTLTGVETDVNQDYDFINDIEVKDPDLYPCDAVTPDVRTSTVSTTGMGTLSTSYVAAGFQVLGNGTSTIVLTGSLVDINNAYDLMDYHPTQDTSYTDVITVFFNDEGCAGYGGDLTTSAIFPLEVVPGPATHFTVVVPPIAENGTPTAATVTALDANNAVANDYAGMVELTSSDNNADLPPDAPLLEGVAILPVTFNTDGTQTVTATDTVDSSIDGTSNTVVVSTAQQVDHFEVIAPPTAVAGTSFDVTVTAMDSSNATVTNYGGTVHFSADSAGTIPADATLTNGTGTFPFTFTTATSVTVTATDTADATVDGDDMLVIQPAATDHFDVDGPANATNGASVNVSVQARDQYGNLTPGYAGTVEVTSSDAAATLPADSVLSSGVGTFAVTFGTDGNQTVTATDTVSSSITGTSADIMVSSQPPAPATHFSVDAPSTAAAASSFMVTVTALDATNATATGYSGTVHLSTDDGIATVPADATLTNGVGTFQVTLRTAGSTTITATDTVTASITGSDSVLVSPDVVHDFIVVAPANATVGAPVDVSVPAYDQLGNQASDYAGTVTFGSTDGAAMLPADTLLVGGAATVAVTFQTPGNQTVTATDTVMATVDGTSDPISVSAVLPGPATHLEVTAVPSATAGMAFDITVEAQDAANATATGYAGTVHLTTTDSIGTVAVDAPLVSGVGMRTVTLRTAGAQTITATDTVTASITGTTASIVVNPAATDHLVVDAPATATNGSPVGVTVTTEDSYGNATPAYAGTVEITSTDGSATLPADDTLTNGAGVFSVTFNTNGTFTVSATDTVNSSIDGTSGPVDVSDAPPAPATHFSVDVPANAVTGTAFNVTITALDATDQTASAYSGTVHLTSSDGSAVLPADATLTNGVGIVSVTLGTAGNQTVTATDTVSASITGTSSAIAVTDPAVVPDPEATVDQSSVQAGGTIQVDGSGFQAGEQVQVWLHSTPLLLATVSADASGTISYLATIPADTAAGSHHIELIGLTSAVQVATASFTVTAANDPAPTTTTTAAPVPTTVPTTATVADTFDAAASQSVAATTTSTSGTLPVTGAAVSSLLVAGLVLVAAGLVVLAGARRRNG